MKGKRLTVWLPPHEHLRKFSRLKCSSNARHCSMKELLGERPAHIPKKAFQLQSRAGVFTLRAGTSSALGVSSRSVALQRRPFHSHRGVFVLLREAIQLPHRARIILRPRAEWRARCVPPARPDSPPFLCAQPIPPVPSFPPHPHPPPPLKTEGGCPHGHLVSMRTGSPFSLTSPPLMYFFLLKSCLISFSPCFLFRSSKSDEVLIIPSVPFDLSFFFYLFILNCRTSKQRKHWLLSLTSVCYLPNTNMHLHHVCVLLAADKHHELSGWVLPPLHPAHFVRLVQATKWTRGGAARVPAASQHQVQKVRIINLLSACSDVSRLETVLIKQRSSVWL